MTHVTIEYMIMIPLLIMQIFLFPLTASWLMNIWVDSRRTLALQDVASHLGSTIQQLYFSLNHETISAGTATYLPGLPPFIENLHYIGNATLQTVLDPMLNSSKVLELMFTLATTGTKVTTSVILGPNVLWRESTFMSNSTNACVSAEKFPNGTICLRFGE
ncbi:hypothetical protein KAU55_02970 [Candidatus Bathyarchaeota archaeon]|nr:hypothetical protein [Candidatus Bathyarchaeota archaeon]